MSTEYFSTTDQHLNTEIIIMRTRIAGTTTMVYSVWEPAERVGAVTHSHSTTTTIADRTYGRVGTNRLPQHLEDLPAGSTDRIVAVGGYHLGLYHRAYAAILRYFPHLQDQDAEYTRSMGEITEQHSWWWQQQ